MTAKTRDTLALFAIATLAILAVLLPTPIWARYSPAFSPIGEPSPKA